MRKICYIIFIAIVFLSSLYADHSIDISVQEKAWLNKNKTLRVRIAKELMPYQHYENGHASGMSVEYLNYFANLFNLKIEYVLDVPWTQALKKIETREGVDVLLKATSNTERLQKMLFTNPYAVFPFALALHKSYGPDTILDTVPCAIALAKSYVINDTLKHDFPQCTFRVYETNLEALQAVNRHEADAYVGDIAITAYFIHHFQLDNIKLKELSKYEAEKQSMVTGKDWPEFISLFNKALETMPPALHVKIKRQYLTFLGEMNKTIPESEIELSDEEKAYLALKPIIKISNELSWQPYDFNDNGAAKGYSVEYIKLLASKLGLHVDFVADTWPRLLEKFKAHEIDIVHSVLTSEQRRAEFLFSKKYMSMQLSLVAQRKRSDIKSLEDLHGKTVGAGKGWESTTFLKEQYPDIKVIEYETTKEMLEAIAFGLIDAGIDDVLTAKYFIDKELLHNIHVVTSIELEKLKDKNLYMMTHKENAMLIGLFNKALNSVSEEELQNLHANSMNAMHINNDFNAFNINEQAYLVTKKEIKMCIDPHWMPLEMNDNGKHVGMAADYMQIMQKFIGIPISVVQTKTWVESMQKAKERECDIYSLVMETPERKAYMNFTKPYISIPLVLVSKLDKVFYSSIDAVGDKPIGIAKGYAYGEILRVRYPNVRFVEVENESVGLQKVQNGTLFATIGTLVTVAHEIQKEYFGSLKIVGKFDEKWELGVGTRNDEPLLLSIFEKAIASISKEESQAIFNKWVVVNYEKSIDYGFIYKIVGFVVLLMAVLLYRQYHLKKYNLQLEKLSNTDKLTGIYNRLKLDDILEYEKQQFDRFGGPLSIIMFDLDWFKKVNDNYGHKTGDEILKTIAKIILENKRDADAFGRWGGEEFLLVCPETDKKGATILAEKLREAIEKHEFPTVVSLTASFGVAEFEKYESIVKVFDKADKALYEAKKSGRNKVVS